MRKILLFLGTIFLFGVPATGVFQSPDADKLTAVLQKARDYCMRLDKAALDFVCQEQVEEDVNQNKTPSANAPRAPVSSALGGGWGAQPYYADSFMKNMYIYDYQFIRKGTEAKERRDLLEKNGIRFPTYDFTEEAYTWGGKSTFVRSTTAVKYKSYKFFTVETQIEI